MEFNSVLFPSPSYTGDSLADYNGELIFIKKKDSDETDDSSSTNFTSSSSSKSKKSESYIPCLLLLSYGKKTSKNFLIFFHGNAEDIFGARDIADKLRINLNMNVLLVEYPGYSIYKEEKCSNRILEDSLTVYDFLTFTCGIGDEDILVFGRSIGTSPAVYLSSKRKPSGLVLMSPFTSIRAVAENIVGNVLKYLVSERFTNIEYIKSVTCPILFIHGQQDTLIPFEHTIKLKDACSCPYEVIFPEEMNHNHFDYDMDLIIPIKEFLERHIGIINGSTNSKDIVMPEGIFNIPLVIKETIDAIAKPKTQKSSLMTCFHTEESEELKEKRDRLEL